MGDAIKTHKCKELDVANKKMQKSFTLACYSAVILGLYADMPETIEECSWKLLNNDDDYYSAEHLNYCPFCGEALSK